MRGVNRLRATDLHAAMPSHRQICMLSSGGEGSGAFWSTAPARPPLRTANAQWAMATRARLGLTAPPRRGLSCSLRNADDDEPCGAPLDESLHHPSLCPKGRTGRLIGHIAVAAALRRHVTRTGTFVDAERHVPELCIQKANGDVEERIMDLVVAWPASGQQFLLDVTVRSPFASELRHQHLQPGVAARNGEKDKLAHYGPSVTPFAVELFGQLGPAALHALAAMHMVSCECGRLRPGTGRASALNLRAVRADLEAAVVQSAAQQAMASSLQALGWAGRRAQRAAHAGVGGQGGGARR
ncbi:unnamed protein product [Prorocentrum cordatum]|uniref:Uncharacterized protein n=1 Tax=Prorocentrum cordatum TaxID=2364126 RepID=A0ABN9XD50_9DINO|nr:unnamed protein product [Polarella glacialis]